MAFTLHPRLAAGTHHLGILNGCRILLKNNAVFPWLIIVPEVDEGIEDLHQLPAERFAEVVFLIREVSNFVDDLFRPEKLNVACLGNAVRQMHIHVVARNKGDPAWPGTVWAFEGKAEYDAEDIGIIHAAARRFFHFADEEPG